MKNKTIALALGGGGARSLAQIPVLEAFDDMGVRPVAVAGVSFGAVIAAAYCAGMSGKAIRRLVIERAHDRTGTFARLIASRAAGIAAWLSTPFGNPLLIDPEKLCAQFLPPEVPEDFAALQIPLTVVATDLLSRGEAALDKGPLRTAVAGSIAIPGLMRPVEFDGRLLVDGAAVNPLPFDRMREKADVIVAVDVSAAPIAPHNVPDPFEAVFATVSVFGHGIVSRKLAERPPELLLRPNAGGFRLFEFFRASAILRAADPVKAEVKERLGKLLG